MGFIELLIKPLLRPRSTGRYPAQPAASVRTTRTPRFLPGLCSDDRSCEAICPTNAIEIQTLEAGSRRWTLDYGKCIFCAECIRVCPSLAIAGTGDFELAARDREGVIAEFELGVARDG